MPVRLRLSPTTKRARESSRFAGSCAPESEVSDYFTSIIFLKSVNPFALNR